MTTREMAKALGRRGGLARAERLSRERRAEIAALGGAARARSFEAARRIAENFDYVEAMDELRGAGPIVKREGAFTGRLPGIAPVRQGTVRAGDGPHRRRR